jgi:hypothetical protein
MISSMRKTVVFSLLLILSTATIVLYGIYGQPNEADRPKFDLKDIKNKGKREVDEIFKELNQIPTDPVARRQFPFKWIFGSLFLVILTLICWRFGTIIFTPSKSFL